MFVKRRNRVFRFRCVHPLGQKPVAPAQAIPKDSLITKDWSKEYKSDKMFQEIYEHLTSKSVFQDGIYSEYFLDNGKLWMNGKFACLTDWRPELLIGGTNGRLLTPMVPNSGNHLNIVSLELDCTPTV